jgi:hypothetical protein
MINLRHDHNNREPHVILLQQILSLYTNISLRPPAAIGWLTQVRSGADSPERFPAAEKYYGATGQGRRVRADKLPG